MAGNFMRKAALAALCLLVSTVAFSDEILRDDFEDGDLTQPLAWDIVRPTVETAESREGDKTLVVSAGGLALAPVHEAPPEYTMMHIYKGIIPFVILQLIGLAVLVAFPGLTTWLPALFFGAS